MTMRLLRNGSLSGVALSALLAGLDRLLAPGYPFGLFAGIVGVAAGGILLLLALAMSATSYLLASRGRSVTLRRRLLAAAIFAGAAGMVGGLLSALLWLGAG